MHPGQFGACEDVHIRGEARRIVERGDAHEARFVAPAISAPQRGLAFGAAMDDVRTPAVGVHGDGHRIALQHLHPVGLDQRIDRKRPARLLLAIAEVTAMDEHRRGGEPVADEAAEAGAVVKCAQNRPPILPRRMIEHSKNKIKLARKKEDVYLPSTKEAAMSALNIKDKTVAEKARR